MNKNLKRGNAVMVVYKTRSSQNTVYGVVLDVGPKAVIIGHNFNSTTPVDKIRISLKSISSVQVVTPQEYQ